MTVHIVIYWQSSSLTNRVEVINSTIKLTAANHITILLMEIVFPTLLSISFKLSSLKGELSLIKAPLSIKHFLLYFYKLYLIYNYPFHLFFLH